MPEVLTESFCERCGTRYEFEAPARLSPLRKTRGLVSGLKNYILSQDALGDAIGDAMRSEEEELAAHQLDAFHQAFNFCIDCRQYACNNCWNDAAGRCRNCAPIAGRDDLADLMEAAYVADHAAMHGAGVLDRPLESDEISRRLGVEAWPQTDLPEPAGNGYAAIEWPEELPAAIAEPEPQPEPLLEPEAAVEVAEPTAPISAEPEPVAAELEPMVTEPEPAFAEFEPVTAEAEPVAVEAEPVAAEPELEPVAAQAESWEEPQLHPILAWEEDSELVLEPVAEEEPEHAEEWVAAVEEPVAEPALEWVAAVEEAQPEWVAEIEPEPVVAEAAPEPEPEPVVAEAAPEPEPEPVVAEAAPEPEPAPEPRRIIPISETIIRAPRPQQPPAPVQSPADREALAARRAQLELLGIDDPGMGAVSSERRILPYRSSGAAAQPSDLLRRTMNASNALWDASAREVAAARSAVAVQNCGSCGLSLSASARFCRRCGTRQARSA
jgi:hypothetical protein